MQEIAPRASHKWGTYSMTESYPQPPNALFTSKSKKAASWWRSTLLPHLWLFLTVNVLIVPPSCLPIAHVFDLFCLSWLSLPILPSLEIYSSLLSKIPTTFSALRKPERTSLSVGSKYLGWPHVFFPFSLALFTDHSRLRTEARLNLSTATQADPGKSPVRLSPENTVAYRWDPLFKKEKKLSLISCFYYSMNPQENPKKCQSLLCASLSSGRLSSLESELLHLRQTRFEHFSLPEIWMHQL